MLILGTLQLSQDVVGSSTQLAQTEHNKYSTTVTRHVANVCFMVQQCGEPRAGVQSVLLVGNPSLQLKGFDVAIAVLSAVNQLLPLHITWVCQTHPTAALLPALLASGLRIHLHVDPPQVVYCGTDWF